MLEALDLMTRERIAETCRDANPLHAFQRAAYVVETLLEAIGLPQAVGEFRKRRVAVGLIPAEPREAAEALAAAEERAATAERQLKDACETLEMYASAWRRELHYQLPGKTHEIDALVLGTRALRVRAETAEAECQRLTKELDEVRQTAAAPRAKRRKSA